MNFKKLSQEQTIALLNEASDWLDISKGRAADYCMLLKEFMTQNERSREHLLGINESFEVIDIYQAWKGTSEPYPGLNLKIKSSLKRGSVLSEDENALTATNEPRNQAFVYFLAGKLLQGGVNVTVVDGIARKGVSDSNNEDIAIEINRAKIRIECKRPFSLKSLEDRTKEASEQLNGAPGLLQSIVLG